VYWKIGIGLALALIVLAGAASVYVALGLCGFCDYSPAHRPTGVPANAIWTGGPDGGSYISCGIDKDRGVNPCTVWNDYTGEVIVSDFWISGEDRAAMPNELKFGWYDGIVIGLDIVTAKKRYLTLERVAAFHPITVCELLTDLDTFDGKAVAVLGRLDVTNDSKTLGQQSCEDDSQRTASSFRRLQVVEESSAPMPTMGRFYLNKKSVESKLAAVKATTELGYVRPLHPIGEFRSWAAVYGRVESDGSTGAKVVRLVSSGNGIEYIAGP
jgi:hypothetical protein